MLLKEMLLDINSMFFVIYFDSVYGRVMSLIIYTLNFIFSNLMRLCIGNSKKTQITLKLRYLAFVVKQTNY